ncbi:MAG: hypothetical protein QOH81_2343 [Sphingomonadales bacterium]|jgi:endonuclease YncB( thermonuclease family)|nr:hypothetical protein [Sphingomonadales bacterium]
MKFSFSRTVAAWLLIAILTGILIGYVAKRWTSAQAPRGLATSPLTDVPLSRGVVPAGVSFKCTPIRVWDGDGPVWCAEGPRLRLAGIAAREIDETCRAGQPCPLATGEEARGQLAKLLGRVTGVSPDDHLLIDGPPLSCTSVGGGGHGRTAAWCVSPIGGDLSCSMIRVGAALRWDRYWHNHDCP